MPLLANDQSAVFAPTHALRWIWDSPRARTFGLLAKPFVAALGAYLLLLRLGAGSYGACLGALAWSGSAALTVWQLYPLSEVLAWFSWLVLGLLETLGLSGSARRRGPIVVALALAAMSLSGHIETTVQLLAPVTLGSILALTFIPRTRPKLPALILGAVAGCLVAAPQLLNVADGLLASSAFVDRGGGAPAAAFSLPPLAIWSWIVPRGFGSPEVFGYTGPVNFSEATAFVGLGTLSLALFTVAFARRMAAGVLATLTLSACALAYGLPVIGRVDDVVPFLRLGGGHRWILLAQWGVCLLAGLGLEVVCRLPLGKAIRGSLLVGGGLATAALLHPQLSATGLSRESALAARAILAGAAEATVAAILIVAAATRLRSLARAGLVALTASAAGLFALGFAPSVPASAIPGSNDLTRALGRELREGRVAPFGWSLRPNLQILAGVDSVLSYDPLVPAAYSAFIRRAGLEPPVNAANFPAPEPALMERAAISAIWIAGAQDEDPVTLGGPPLSPIPAASDGFVRAYRLAAPHPLVGFYASATFEADRETTFDRLAKGRIPTETVVITGSGSSGESGPADRGPSEDGGRDATGRSDALPAPLEHRWEGESLITAAYDAPARGWIVFRELDHPGWTAALDGRPVPWREADGLFMAVETPPGRHVIVFEYRPRLWTISLVCVPVGLILMALAPKLSARARPTDLPLSRTAGS